MSHILYSQSIQKNLDSKVPPPKENVMRLTPSVESRVSKGWDVPLSLCPFVPGQKSFLFSKNPSPPLSRDVRRVTGQNHNLIVKKNIKKVKN